MPEDKHMVPIGVLAKRFALAASALRYWEERGLIAPSSRQGGRRYYDRDQVLRIGLVRTWQRDALMSLDEIGLVLEGGDSWRDVVRNRIAAIDTQMERLAAGKVQLEHLLECPRTEPATCPHLQANVESSIER